MKMGSACHTARACTVGGSHWTPAPSLLIAGSVNAVRTMCLPLLNVRPRRRQQHRYKRWVDEHIVEQAFDCIQLHERHAPVELHFG